MTYQVQGKDLSGRSFPVSIDTLKGAPMISRVTTVSASTHDPFPKVGFEFHLVEGELPSMEEISVSVAGLVDVC
jgi:hypothetical protein